MQRKCIGVVILDDSESDVGETFEVSIEKLGISTTVTIVDDESGMATVDLYVHHMETGAWSLEALHYHLGFHLV